MELSQKQKTFSGLIFSIFEIKIKFGKIFKEKMTIIAHVFAIIRTRINVVT